MVSLTEKIGYYCLIADKPKIISFNSFIKGESINIQVLPDTNETDIVYFKLIQSISSGNIFEFKKVYEDFSRRRPSTESAWIYNDFLIFIFICGIEKFLVEKTWINEVIQVRSTGNQQHLAINHTFRNILIGNTHSTDQVTEVVIVFLELLNRPQLSNDLINFTYTHLSSNTKIFDAKNDFLITISLRAFDIILLTKDTPDAVEISRIRKFKKEFLKKIAFIRDLLYYCLLSLFAILSFKYIREYQGLKDYVTDIGSIFQLCGFAFLAAFKWFQRQLQNILLRIFGYDNIFKNERDKQKE